MNDVINTPVTRNTSAKLAIIILNVLLITKPFYHICYGVVSLLKGYELSGFDFIFILEYLFTVLVSVAFIFLTLKNKLTSKLIGIIYIVSAVVSFIGNVTSYAQISSSLGAFNIFRLYGTTFVSAFLVILISLFFFMQEKRNIGWAIFALVRGAFVVLEAFVTIPSLFSDFARSSSEAGSYGLGLGLFQCAMAIVSAALSVLLVLIVLKRKNEALNAGV